MNLMAAFQRIACSFVITRQQEHMKRPDHQKPLIYLPSPTAPQVQYAQSRAQQALPGPQPLSVQPKLPLQTQSSPALKSKASKITSICRILDSKKAITIMINRPRVNGITKKQDLCTA